MHHWICPSCQHPLKVQSKSYRCANGHSFDVAKEGYVNLLLAHQKRSKAPGDNKAMVEARRQFLGADHYLPLVGAMATMLGRHLQGTHTRLFDAGCGEGYYLSHMVARLGEQASVVEGHGCDIAKPAIQKAAKKYPGLAFAVASTFNLPLGKASMDAVIQVFAPAKTEEISRVLKAQGLWLQVNPGADHLSQLKAMVYEQGQAHTSNPDVPPGFIQRERREIRFDIALPTGQQRLNLLQMTPFFWSCDEAQRQRIVAELAHVSAHFELALFGKAGEYQET